MKINVPDLTAGAALDFCIDVNNIEEIEGEEYYVDFGNVRTCDPFPMLIVSREIKRKREEFKHLPFYANNYSNTYAKHMKFYSACGLNLGDDVEFTKGNSNYSCITKFSVNQLKEEGRENLDIIQEVIEKKSKDMASIVAQGNIEFRNWLAFVIRELMRNIPEHSKSDTIWYCAQYWPSYDLVELAILDEGVGIKESLSENINHVHLIKTDEDAIRLSLEPGISGTMIENKTYLSQSEWDNSGYGLYMVSEMCAELNASFILASGKSAVKVCKENGNIVYRSRGTNVHGTAIQIRIKPSATVDYNEIRRKIVLRGEAKARKNSKAIHTASKSSRGF